MNFDNLDEMKQKILDHPQDCELYLAYGLALHKLGQVREAREAFSQGLAVDPFHVHLRQQRARKMMTTHFWQAVSDFSLVTRLQPSFWEAWYYMGVVYYFNDHVREALSCFTRCLKEAESSCVSLVPVIDWLYTINMKLGDHQAAVNALSHAHPPEADPVDEDYAYARRLMLYEGKLKPETFFDRDVLKQRGETDIDYVTQAYGLANHYHHQGKIELSNQLLLDIVKHDQYPTAFAWILTVKDLKARGIEYKKMEGQT